jgi:hypothetical protein
MLNDDLTFVPHLSTVFGEEVFTYSPELTSALHSALTANNFFDHLTTIQSFLSSFRGIPEHPWEALKYQHLGPDWTPPALSSLEVPEDFKPHEHIKIMNNISTKYHNVLMDEIQNAEGGLLDTNKLSNVHYTVLSADEHVYHPDVHRNYIGFIETLRSIETADIKADPHTVAKKLIHHYTSGFSV